MKKKNKPSTAKELDDNWNAIMGSLDKEKKLVAAAKRWYRVREEHGWLRPDTTGMNCQFCRKEFRKLVKAIEGCLSAK